jgi:hypothetical protein
MSRPGEYPIPPRARAEHCGSCGASITWAMTPGGRATPLDLGTVERRDGQRWALTHFARCPQSREWRRAGPVVAQVAPAAQAESEGARRVRERRERFRLADGSLIACWWMYGRIDHRSGPTVSDGDIAREAAAVAGAAEESE